MSIPHDTEIWRDIKGYEGFYQVSNLGRVRSVYRRIKCRSKYGGFGYRTYKGGIMSSRKESRKDQYVQVSLCKSGKVIPHAVHRLVLEAFVGPCPEGMICCHKDDVRNNNRLDNLRWDTYGSNNKDAHINGRMKTGERHYRSVFQKKDVKWIRLMYESGDYSQQELADLFNASKGAVAGITTGVTWRDYAPAK